MIIQSNGGYTDFLNIVNDFGRRRSVFYLSTVAGLFVIYVVPDGRDVVITSGNLGAQPSTFTTDFPSSIQLSSTLTLS
jgi:hypothetical protein